MKLFAVALLLLVAVILIVSLVYILVSTRHKEKLVLLNKGLNPKDYLEDRFLPNTLRIGCLLLGVGIGFMCAMFIDEYAIPEIDNPAIYPAFVLSFGGIGLLIFHRVYKKQKKQSNQE